VKDDVMTNKSLRNPSLTVADKVCGAVVGLAMVMVVAAGFAATVLSPQAAPANERIWVKMDPTHCVLVLTSETANRSACQE
jgi:hypothetical protein